MADGPARAPPVHASWLNQIEIVFSIIQRKVIKPADFADLAALADRLCRFEDRYNETAAPFDWRFTTDDLTAMLERIDNRTEPEAALAACQEAAKIAADEGPPESTKANLTARLNSYARNRWPSLAGIDVRFRTNFAYVDGRTRDGTVLKLCRLRYGGSAHLWGFAIYRASHDDDEDSYLPTGTPLGTVEDALDCACNLYLEPLNTSTDTPTN